MNLRETFVDLLPKQAIRVFASPYVAGDSMGAALAKARELADHGVASTIDVLGEDARGTSDVDRYIEIYTRLVETISADAHLGRLPENIKPSISLKPSMFVLAPKDGHGMICDPVSVRWDDCEVAIEKVLATTSRLGLRLTVDMENHQWTDATLAMYARFFAKYGQSVGTVLQSRLNRTFRDVEALPDGCRIRLCIGIYSEPRALATQSFPEMKARMIPLAKRLLEKNIFLEFATHDLPLIQRFVRDVVVPQGIQPDRFETQTLMGVPRDRLIGRLTSGAYFSSFNGSSPQLREGVVHRMYVPFAEDWDQAIAYSRRRLRHSPNLFWTGFVNAPRVLYYSIFGK